MLKKLLRKINSQFKLWLLIFVFGVSCGGPTPEGTRTPPNIPKVEIEVGVKLNEVTVKRLVQNHIVKSGGTVIVTIPYYETVTQKTVCHTPSHPSCYEDPTSLVTGYSMDTIIQERKFRTEQRRLPDQVMWETYYDESTEDWITIASFSLEDIQDSFQELRWEIDDDTQGVREIED